LGVDFAKYSLALYGNNLSDSRGAIDRRYNPFHLVPATDLTVIQPRTVGIRADYRY